MNIELFKVTLKRDGTGVEINLNEDVLVAYGLTVEDIQENFDNTNLCKGIQDYLAMFKDIREDID